MAARTAPTTADILKALSEEFDEDFHEEVTKDGVTLTNVKPVHYIDRLNDVLPGAWSVKTTAPAATYDKHQLVGFSAESTVTLHLPDGDRNYSGVGSEGVQEGSTVSKIANIAKSTATDAFKRACAMFGPGTYLYKLEVKEADEQPAEKPRTAARTSRQPDPEPEAEPDERPARRSSSERNERSGSSRSDNGSRSFRHDRSKVVGIGDDKEATWEEVECSLLNWIIGKLDKDSVKYKAAVAEKALRKEDGTWEEPKAKGGNRRSTRNSGRVSRDSEWED